MQQAVIYCRVSSQRQVKEGHGLESQQSRCQKYAVEKGYQVVKVFEDSAVSGRLFERKAMQKLLAFLKQEEQTAYVIIFDDLKRFARDVEVHIKLKRLFKQYNATLECLNFTFEDSPEGTFIETVVAAQAQLDREQNQRQVIQKMTVRMENGYWCMKAPAGYAFKKDKEHGKRITPKPDEAPLIKKALEGFANGTLLNQKQFVDFLSKKGFRGGKPICLTTAKNILEQSLYAGYYEYPKWDVLWRKGKHTPIISLMTYSKIQERLVKKVITIKKTDTPDFPLRGLVKCSYCNKILTSSHVRGRSKYYPLYTCNNTHCGAKPKNIQKERLENDYLELLYDCRARENFLGFFEAIFLKKYKCLKKEVKRNEDNTSRKEKQIQKQIELLTERISKASNESLIAVYEGKILKLQNDLKTPKENPIFSKAEIDIGTAVKNTMAFMQKPYQYWKEANVEQKKRFHQCVFSSPLKYSQEKGFGTVQTTLLFSLKRKFEKGECSMVRTTHNTWNQIFEQVLFVARVLQS